MMKFKFGLYSFMFGLMLGVAPAWADVDISGKEKVEVGSWGELKAAVEDSQNAGKVIVLTGDIQADKNNPIDTVAGAGIIIDGGGFTITGQEGTSDGQFINFGSEDKTDLIIQNVKLEGFGNVRTGSYYARGGAIYNLGTMILTNSSFYDNYVQTGAMRDSNEGQLTFGGAIYNEGDLTIRADNGNSIFRGNKVIWGDGEDSSAISFAGNLKLDSINNGLIQFDDKVSGTEIKQTMNKDETDSLIKNLNDMGFEIKQDGDNYIATGEVGGAIAVAEFIKQPDGTYIATAISGEMTITGDSSSKVVFNNAIEKVAKIDISGTNVDVNEGAGTISKTVTHDGGVLNINADAKCLECCCRRFGARYDG